MCMGVAVSGPVRHVQEAAVVGKAQFFRSIRRPTITCIATYVHLRTEALQNPTGQPRDLP